MSAHLVADIENLTQVLPLLQIWRILLECSPLCRYRGSYMGAPVLLNLLNKLGKRDKMHPCPTPSPHLQDPTTFSSMRYGCKSGPNILEVYIIYLHVYMCQNMRFCHLSHVPRLRLACTFLKFHQNFHVLTHIYM